MIIKEYRIVLPMTVEEYQVAQLYSVAVASKNETGGGEGIQVLKNEPFMRDSGIQPKSPLLNGRYTEGQFTHKIYHLASKVPGYIRWLAPKGSLEVHEEAWNAYPYCRTVVSNPDYMQEKFVIKIESIHLPDHGTTENAHGLDRETLEKREVVKIDIANDSVDRRVIPRWSKGNSEVKVRKEDLLDDFSFGWVEAKEDYKRDEDPSRFKSQKTGRGPLVGQNWERQCNPVMCCYKLVTVEFKWWGLQSKVEKFIHRGERRIFTNFHRQVFCWTDQWYGMTMTDIRVLEDRTKVELDEKLKSGEVCGTTEDE